MRGESVTWCDLLDGALPVEETTAFVSLPWCGATVTFLGTVRDHAEGREGVTGLTYEAYEREARPRMEAVAAEARTRWPDLGGIALLHRVGDLDLGDVAVVVTVSAPHRSEAFEAARYCIDAVKATVPIWKTETWAGGIDSGTGAVPLTDAADVAST